MLGLRGLPSAGRAALALLLVGAVALSGCDKKGGDTSADNAGAAKSNGGGKKADEFKAGSKADMFTFAIAADPETFDTAKMSGAPEGRVAMQLFEGLLVPGPTTKGIQDSSKLVRPGVAKSYDVSEDGKTYTFHLRKDAKWSNGDPVTAQDFIYSWKRVLMPADKSGFAADYAAMMYIIKGAEAYNAGKSEWKDVGVEAPDEHTIVVHLKYVTPYFPELAAFYTFFPVPQKVVEKYGDDWTKPDHIVSNGAYILADYKPQQEILFKKNPHYWDKDNVKIAQAKARIITDRTAVTNAYRAGELHWSGASLPVSQISSFVSHPDYQRAPLLGTYYFKVNVSKDTPLANPKVRQALSMATDRDTLVNNVLKGLYKPATSYVPTSMAGYESTTKIEYNPRKAKELLKEAGYGKGGKPFPKITLLYNTDQNHKLVAETIQQQWKSNLGIDVELVNKEWKMYQQDIDNLNYEIARAGWIGDYNDPMTFLDMYETGNGNNDTGWSNAEYDKLLEQARQEPDHAKRTKILQQAEQLLVQKGPIIPIYFYTNNALVARRIKGFEPHNRDIHLLKYMSLPE